MIIAELWRGGKNYLGVKRHETIMQLQETTSLIYNWNDRENKEKASGSGQQRRQDKKRLCS